MKKAQVNQVFVFIMALLVIGLIAVVGSGVVNYLFEVNCKISETEFNSEVSKLFERHRTFGSFNKVDLKPSCDVEVLCFIDDERIKSGSIEMTPFNSNYAEEFKIMEDSVKNNIESNVFVITDELVKPFGFYPEIITNNEAGYICYKKKRSKFTLEIEGKGKTIVIS